jgi:hypothetical protein
MQTEVAGERFGPEAEDRGIAPGGHVKFGIGVDAAAVFGASGFVGFGFNLTPPYQFSFIAESGLYVAGAGLGFSLGELGTGRLTVGTSTTEQFNGDVMGVGVEVDTRTQNVMVAGQLNVGAASGVQVKSSTVQPISAIPQMFSAWYSRLSSELFRTLGGQ